MCPGMTQEAAGTTLQEQEFITCLSYKTQVNNCLHRWEEAAVDSQLATSWLPRTCIQGLRASVCCMTWEVVDHSDSTIAISTIHRVIKRHTCMLCTCRVAKQCMLAAVVSLQALSWFPRPEMLDVCVCGMRRCMTLAMLAMIAAMVFIGYACDACDASWAMLAMLHWRCLRCFIGDGAWDDHAGAFWRRVRIKCKHGIADDAQLFDGREGC